MFAWDICNLQTHMIQMIHKMNLYFFSGFVYVLESYGRISQKLRW